MADLTTFDTKVAEIAASSNVTIRLDFAQFGLECLNSNFFFVRITGKAQFFVARDIFHVGEGFRDDCGLFQ